MCYWWSWMGSPCNTGHCFHFILLQCKVFEELGISRGKQLCGCLKTRNNFEQEAINFRKLLLPVSGRKEGGNVTIEEPGAASSTGASVSEAPTPKSGHHLRLWDSQPRAELQRLGPWRGQMQMFESVPGWCWQLRWLLVLETMKTHPALVLDAGRCCCFIDRTLPKMREECAAWSAFLLSAFFSKTFLTLLAGPDVKPSGEGIWDHWPLDSRPG